MNVQSFLSSIVLISVFTFSPIEKAFALPKSQLNCLAEAVYFEARGEPKAGQKLVAKTILQRTKSPKFPSTVCGVVNQKSQFSYKSGRNLRIREPKKYKEIESLVKVEAQKFSPSSSHPLYFYNPKKARPAWAKRMKVLQRAGNHVFLRPT